MSRFRTISDVDVSQQRLLVRVDFNVPLNQECRVVSDRRIQAALPTIQYAMEHAARVVLLAHLGRPGGRPEPGLSLRPVAERLRELIGDVSVRLVTDIEHESGQQRSDEILLLENLRFYPGEEQAEDRFAAMLSRFGDIYVNEAFASCHRNHASMVALPELFDPNRRLIGFHVQNELAALDELLAARSKPLVVVLGGVKVPTRLGLIRALLERADRVLIGGLLAYTFMHAKGQHVGASPIDEKGLAAAAEIIEQAGDKLVLPVDHVISVSLDTDAQVESAVGGIPPHWYGVDIGPNTCSEFSSIIEDGEIVVWNGPMGKFEQPTFRRGTEAVAHALASCHARTIVGGGETSQAVDQFGLTDRISHVSTGGDSFLRYLQGDSLPALAVLGRTDAAVTGQHV